MKAHNRVSGLHQRIVLNISTENEDPHQGISRLLTLIDVAKYINDKWRLTTGYLVSAYMSKEGNDQESIQLPNTFRSKTPKGKKDALKVTAPQSKHYKQKSERTVSSQIFGQTDIQNKKKNAPTCKSIKWQL